MIGLLCMIFATVLFLYVTIWLMILVSEMCRFRMYTTTSLQPFFDEGHVFRGYFLDDYYAAATLVLVYYFTLVFLSTFIGFILVKSATETSPNMNMKLSLRRQ